MLLKLAEQLGISPDAITLAITIATLVVSIAHSRGNDMPILSGILRLLGAKPIAPPATPIAPSPATSPDALPALGEGRIIEIVRRELERLRADRPAA